VSTSPITKTLSRGVSVSGVGGGRDIRDAVQKAAATSRIVEIAVGGRALDGDPYEDLMTIRDTCGVTFVGHHTLPLVEGAAVRPGFENQREVADLLERYEITTYSAHPLQLSETSEDGLFEWFCRTADLHGERGISFSLETMYTPRDARDHVSGRWHLADEASVTRFVTRAMARGYRTPLLLDLAHIHIEAEHGRWRWESVQDLVSSDAVSCVHVSENDGRRDRHDSLSDTHRIREELTRIEEAFSGLVVDEGRLR